MKYNEGDLVTIKINARGAEGLNRDEKFFWAEIVKHEPPPFDWSTVKPGMCFNHKYENKTFFYVGPSLYDNRYVVMQSNEHYVFSIFPKNTLTRETESHDIEVKS